MSQNFSVAISYKDDLGYIEYKAETHEIKVFLNNEEGKLKAERFLAEVHKIKIPRENLLDFTEEFVDAKNSEGDLKIVLTRLWEVTGIHVDWSRPVDYVKAHPHY